MEARHFVTSFWGSLHGVADDFMARVDSSLGDKPEGERAIRLNLFTNRHQAEVFKADRCSIGSIRQRMYYKILFDVLYKFMGNIAGVFLNKIKETLAVLLKECLCRYL